MGIRPADAYSKPAYTVSRATLSLLRCATARDTRHNELSSVELRPVWIGLEMPERANPSKRLNSGTLQVLAFNLERSLCGSCMTS